jgi:hypothetical protein
MKTNWLITTAAAAILASTGLAVAQGMNERGGQSPGAMDKGAPSGQQMQRQQQPSGAAQQRDMQRDKPGTTGQAQQRTGPDDQKQPRGAQKDDQKQPRGAQKDDQKQPRGAQKDDQRQPRGAQRDDDKQPRDRAQQKQDRQDKQGRAETTGRGDAAGAKLTTEQRTRIRNVVVSKSIPRVTNVNFNVSVGTVVPRTVTFHPIPVEIVEIYPAWRGYRVILVGSQLIIVHPSSYRIVAVIAV